MAFDQAKADAICERIASGESLRTLAKSLKLGSHTKILTEAANNPAFAEQYSRAMVLRADSRAMEIDDLANRCADGEIDPNAARVAIGAKQWAASKLHAKKYGDRIQQDIDGTLRIEVVDPFAKKE